MKIQINIFFSLIFCSSVVFSQSLNFGLPKIFDAGYNSNMLVAADFNNDGLIDIATANYGGDNVSILLKVSKDSFASEITDTAGNGTWDIAYGDFNGDSILDLVVSNYLDDDISILIGIGDGTFKTKVDYPAYNNPKGVVVGYFNNDNKLDIAVANDDVNNKVSIYLGNGNGTFASKTDYNTGDRPHDIFAGYFDQDTNLDLITINRADDDIAVLRGNGNGTFKTPVTFDVGHFPEYGTLGYFNNDSLIDLAVCNAWNFDSVSILLGDTGTIFKAAQNFYAGYRPFKATAADFNLDGFTDLALTIANYDSINILLGNGDGSFQKPIGMASGDNPHGIIALDVEGDSDYDLLNVNYFGGGSTYLYLNTLCPKISFSKNNTTTIDGTDGSAIALVSGGLRPYTYMWNNSMSLTDSIITNLSAGIYNVEVRDSLGCKVTADVQIKDPVCSLSLKITKSHVSFIDGADGEAIVTPVNGVGPYTFLWNDSNSQTDSIAVGLIKGTFQIIVTDSIGCKDSAEVKILELPCINQSVFYSNYGANDVELCYINNDSILDMVTLYSVAYSTDKVNILFGQGDGTFNYHSSFTVGTGGDQPVNLEVNDFNGDDINDIIVSVPDGVNGISVYLGNGDSTFQSKVNYTVGSRPWDMVSYDIDYDGDNDLLICREQGDDVRILKNNGNAVFSAYSSKSVGWNPMNMVAGYLNNDTLLDLVVVNRNQANISVLLGYTNSSFLSSVSYIAGLHPYEATLGDFNNDSVVDIAVSGYSPDRVYVFFGNGDGTFQNRKEYMAGNSPRGIASYDINNDSNLDLVVANSADSNLLILLGEGNGAFDSVLMYHLNGKPYKLVTRDVDNDGDEDLIVSLSSKDSMAILYNCFVDKCMFLNIDSVGSADRNQNNGYASISVLGSNPPYSFAWNDSLKQKTAFADSLFAGTYKLIVSDSSGCKDSIIVTISETPCEQDTHYIHSSICSGDSILFGGEYRYQSGFYYDTLMNIKFCDSIMILDLVEINPSFSSITVQSCYSYLSPQNKTYYNTGTYTDTLMNYLGCDSIITIYLSIFNSSSSSLAISDCYSYIVPSGDETYTSNGVYNDTILNYHGCDSFITINLTILDSSSSLISKTVCNIYTVPSGDETYTQSGIYQDTISNYFGCDSLITIDLTVYHKSTSTIYKSVCYSYTVPSGDETYTQSGIYQDTIPNYFGCDSLITIDLTVYHKSTSSIYKSVCYSYTVPSGDESYTQSGIYQDTIPNYFGCDSLITIDLTVHYNSMSSISEVVCNNYIVPSGDETYTQSGIYQDTILSYFGCDSLITINLTVNYSSNSSISKTVCNNYTVPSGDESYTQSGIYQDTIPNFFGCDSFITLDLTVHHNSSSSIIKSVCKSYTVPSGDETYTQDGIYYDTIPTYFGCDSFITIDLTISQIISSFISKTVCNSYTVPSGDETYTQSGIYLDTISAYFGCDSLIEIDLTVHNKSNSSIKETVCNSYTVPSGKNTYYQSGIYQDIIPNYFGCDSLIEIDLTIHKKSNSSIKETACNSYTVPSGKRTYYQSGNFQDTILNYFGCDSLIEINLTINTVDVGVSQIGDTLMANATNSIYQWLNCDNGFSVVTGQKGRSYIADDSGNYAVEITQNNCIDTSNCYYVNISGFIENDFGNDLTVFPNPTNGNISIKLTGNNRILTVTISNVLGQKIFEEKFTNQNLINLDLNGDKGIYFLNIKDTTGKRAIVKVFKM